MKRAELALPEVGLIAATRGMLGAGIGLLIAHRFTDHQCRVVGRTLVGIGVLSTVPLLLDVLSKRR